MALAAAIAATVPATPAAAAAPPAATFNKNLLLKGSNGAAEPSIRTDMFGRSFVTGPTGIGGGCPAFRVSHDGSTSKFIGRPDQGVGGGDCDWAIGPQETSATITPPASDSDLAFSSLTLPNITVAKSDDGGTTFSTPNPAAAQVAGDDRMWMAADPKLNAAGFGDIFLTYHDVSLGEIELSVSLDGGQTYAQNSPLINFVQVPAAQVAGALAGNELGNIVALRPKLSNGSFGPLTLYSIFQTPDSSADNANQGVAGTANFNRVYEAVGTVVTDSAPPVIQWTDSEIYHGPVGARYNRIFPVTAVDRGGTVYAFWSDGNHILYKTDATGTGWNPGVPPGQIANPAGVNTAIMPWVDAGSSGRVDVVYYGASGGLGQQPNPQDDPNNVWNAYFAQTIDGGASWTVSKASDHNIHKGPLCIDGLNCNLIGNRDRTLLDFFQVSIDPTNGAADIAFADDSAAPGNSVMYFTRQCSGAPAITGLSRPITDCVPPPPPPTPPQGTTCPGPQILDFAGDAPNNYPGGDGQNMKNLDILNAFFGTPDATHLRVTLTLNNLSTPPPPNNILSGLWAVYWRLQGDPNPSHYYFVQASNTGPVITYRDGSWDASTDTFTGSGSAVAGSFNPGPNGTIVWTILRSDVGNPANGAPLTNTFADTRGAYLVAGTGLRFIAAADRAPDGGYGANYVVGQTCTGGGGGGGCREADGTGNVQGKNGGNASFQSDEDGCIDGDQNGEQLSDPGAKEDFRSTQVQSVQFNDTLGTMTVYGLGVSNGLPVSFLIVEQAATATTPAFYSIELSDGYVNSGNLITGTITLH
jgi:hypothetical protein